MPKLSHPDPSVDRRSGFLVPSFSDSKNLGEIDRLIQYAINYYTDFVLPKKEYLKIDNHNKQIFEDIYNLLQNTNPSETSEEIQTKIYEIGKKHNFQNLRDFFKLV